jgi:uncharacterized protein YeeX (DUF496 family)
MQSKTIQNEVADIVEDLKPPYEDSIEGMLQYHADLSLYYASEAKTAKTAVKRNYFKKKQIKNNEKMYRLLVRTPNQFNPLMQYIQQAIKPAEIASDDGSVLVPYVQVVDDTASPYVPGILTTSSDDL